MQTIDKVYSQGPYIDRAQALVAQMSLKEKLGLMAGAPVNKLAMAIDALVYRRYNRKPLTTNGIERLGVPPVAFCDGPRGVVSGHSTCFPVAMARGASFDPEIEKEVGVAIGKEVLAAGGNYFGGVCINLLRHPAWGRAQETYGEDPYLLAAMGVAVTEGVQSQGIMACLKHYAMNSMENARFRVNVSCTGRTLHEVYLPHFKACVDAGAASVMTAYNQVRGDYCGHNKSLIRDILHDEWGFRGFTLSDFIWGLRDTRKGLEAGLDIEMPWPKHYGKKLVKAVHQGELDESLIDEAAVRIVSTTLAFDSVKQKYSVDPSIVAGEAHRALALRAAERSMTLMKNVQGNLPLSASSIKRLLVLGKLATVANIGDHGSSNVHPPYVVTPLQGLQTLAQQYDFSIDHYAGESPTKVAHLCSKADAVVIIAGCRHNDEGEHLFDTKYSPGGDRDNLNLRDNEIRLIRTAAQKNDSVSVVLIGGSAILTSGWDNDVSSILHAYYPGMEGGHAIAKILFGEVNPGGKLPFTVPQCAGDLPNFDKNANAIEYGYCHGYTLLDENDIEPAYAFGHGLSYTQFETAQANFSLEEGHFVAELTVTNIGDRAGDEVVQLYIGSEHGEIDRPEKVLKSFQRISLEPGKSKVVRLAASIDSMRWYSEAERRWELEYIPYNLYIGTSSRRSDLHQGQVDLSHTYGDQ
jgi:beta-glucosidase